MQVVLRVAGLFVHLVLHCYWTKPGASTSAVARTAVPGLAPWLPSARCAGPVHPGRQNQELGLLCNVRQIT